MCIRLSTQEAKKSEFLVTLKCNQIQRRKKIHENTPFGFWFVHCFWLITLALPFQDPFGSILASKNMWKWCAKEINWIGFVFFSRYLPGLWSDNTSGTVHFFQTRPALTNSLQSGNLTKEVNWRRMSRGCGCHELTSSVSLHSSSALIKEDMKVNMSW